MRRVSTFSERIAQFRREQGLTLECLSEQTGIPPQSLNRYELCQRTPKIDTATDIADTLGINPLWLQGYNVPIERGEAESHSAKRVPIIATVRAGFGEQAEMEYAGHEYAFDIVENEEFAYFKVVGDSMAPDIHEGDLALVHRQSDVESGDIAVVIVDVEEGMLKKVVKQKGAISLISHNPAYPPRIIIGENLDTVTIWGRVVALYRKY